MEAPRRTRVKLICNWASPEELCREWNRMSHGDFRWNDIEVTWEDRDVDFYVIVNRPRGGEYYVPARTIVFQMEPWCGAESQTWGVKTWGEWAEPDPARFLQVRSHRRFVNNAFWQLEATYRELKTTPIVKTRVLSSICGAKYFDPGHVKRVEFLKFLEAKADPAIALDIYADVNAHRFRSYRGPIPGGKEGALAPYKYYFMAENNAERNFITEKLWEPLLMESLCFYWGCPNASDYVDPRAFIALDLDDFESAYQTMRRAILGNEWEKRLDVIRREKQKVLEHYQFFPTLERVLKHELRFPPHPTDEEVRYHKYFHRFLGRSIRTACFIHSCTIHGNSSILDELLATLRDSGLLERLDALVIVNLGDELALPEALASSDKIHVVEYSKDVALGERPTLELLRTFASVHEDGKLLYLRTKGASHGAIRRPVTDWTRYMLHFVVERHAACLAALAEYDAIGCNLLDEPRRHFSGNFWWANARYVKRLAPVPTTNRHAAEMWILSDPAGKALSLHDSGINHYREPYPRERYVSAAVSTPADAGEPPILSPTTRRPPRAPSICLTMIVKNEAHVVCEALASALPYITDYVIVDTGSTDGTQATVRRFFAARGVEGHLFERPWTDFGTNRTEALRLAREHSDSDYLWMMDADDVIRGDPHLEGLTLDGYHLRIGPGLEYWRIQIFKRSVAWRYVGVLHEYPTCDLASPALGHVDGDYQLVSRRLGSRNRSPEKYQRDAEVLEGALAAEPDNTRHVFYLAQSYFDAGNFEAALQSYRRRVTLGGWEQEVFYSRFRCGQCLERLGRAADEVEAAYVECFAHHPSRAEPLVSAAKNARTAGDFATAYAFAAWAAQVPRPTPAALFVHADVYDYKALDEQAIAAFHIGRFEESFRLNSELLEQRPVPERDRPRIEKNRDCSVPFIKKASLRYSATTVQRILDCPPAAAPRVTLSITTCKRLDLFVQTMSSFLNVCVDVDLIDRWICVDDNSSAADRAEMQRLFPFFEFVWKGPDEKGHARSMNMIRDRVRTPFLLHLEDDWHFFAERKYVEPAIEILSEAPDLGQVLFNRTYAEVLTDREIPGGLVAFSWEHGHRYRIHEHYDPASDEYARFHRAHGFRPSNAYWPHYSLRPGVLKSKVLETVGPYDETVGHFELDFARRYVRAGFRTAFFDGVFALHIGRLTRDRQRGGPPNAYELNQTAQFEPPQVGCGSLPPGGMAPGAHDDASRHGQDQGLGIDIVVINLDRRPDRLERFREQAARHNLPPYRRIAAVDGQHLVLTDELRHLFRENDFNYRRAVIGCALSHLEVWRSVRQVTLVFEDDVELVDAFVANLDATLGQAAQIDPAWDLIVLGWHPWAALRGEPPRHAAAPALGAMNWTEYMGGSFAYLISPCGAAKLWGRAQARGVQNGIDRFVMLQADILRAYRPALPIAFSQCARAGHDIDSDIQYDWTSLTQAKVRGAGPPVG